ncbi:MAG: aspartate aminotransferase family protein [Desulfurococcaceae archaeon]
MSVEDYLGSSKVMDILRLSNEVFPKCAFLKYYPLVIAKGRGSRVVDINGNEYIDFVSGAAVFNIGHLHRKIVEAVSRQLDKYLAYPMVYFYTEEPCLLAKKLIEITPGSFRKKVLFGFSGSDAMDLALMIARAYSGRRYIMAFKGSFHGSTYLSMSASGIYNEKIRNTFMLLNDVVLVEYPNPYRNPWGINGYENPVDLSNMALNNIEKALRKLNEEIAVITLEAIQGDGGIVVPPKYFVQGLHKLAHEYGIVLLVDEVKTGIGRTGKWWAIQHFDVEPDIIVTGKALGGGMPISAVIGREEILDSLPPVGLSFTLSGHAVSVVSALATLEVIEKENMVERARVLGEYIYNRLSEIMSRSKIVGDVRGKGLLLGLEIVVDKSCKEPSKPMALKVIWSAWKRGVILLTVGVNGNVVRIAPPLNIPGEDVDKALETIESAVVDTEEGRIPDQVLEYMTGW